MMGNTLSGDIQSVDEKRGKPTFDFRYSAF